MRHLLPLLLVGAVLTVATPTEAKLEKGRIAPDFVGKTWINTEPTSLKDQRGRLVFLELFSTG